MGMLNDLKNCGVQDVLFFCVDGLPGFKEVTGAVFPQAQIVRIHFSKTSKETMSDKIKRMLKNEIQQM